MTPRRAPRTKPRGDRPGTTTPQPDHAGVLAVPCPSCDAPPTQPCRFDIDQADDGTLRTVQVPPHVRRHLLAQDQHP